MNAPLSRRALLGATAAVGAAALPAVASAPSNSDAELFRLLDRFDAARTAWDAAGEPYDEAMSRARAAYPPRPDALRSGFRDHTLNLGVGASERERQPDGRIRMFFLEDDVAKLRARGPVTRWASVGADHPEPLPREADPQGEARRQEIIAAHDGWMRAREAVEDATGYTAAHEVIKATAAAINAAEDAVKLCQPRTVAGLVHKAAWVADLVSRDACEEDLAQMFVGQVAAFGGVAS